jgi:threonine dehydratase
VKAAVRHYYSDTHNLVEGAGAAPLAALLKDRRDKSRRYAVICSGGNIDRDHYIDALSGG